MKNAHSAFFAVVMCLKEATGDRTCESADQTDQFLSNNRRKVLDGKGRISHEQAIEKGWYFFLGAVVLNDEMCYYKESVKISGILGEETYGSNTDAGWFFYGCDHLGVCSEKSRIF